MDALANAVQLCIEATTHPASLLTAKQVAPTSFQLVLSPYFLVSTKKVCKETIVQLCFSSVSLSTQTTTCGTRSAQTVLGLKVICLTFIFGKHKA